MCISRTRLTARSAGTGILPVPAVYTVLTADQVGATKGYLQHAGLSGNGTVVTKCAIIKQSTLIRGSREGMSKNDV